jgi:CBS domain-containing protein
MTVDPVTCPTTATVHEAATLMRDRRIGNVLVVDPERGLRGIVTDRDLVVRAIAPGFDPHTVTVGDVCTPTVQCVGPDASVRTVAEVMRDSAVRRVPVLDEDNRPVGIVALGDLARWQDRSSVLGGISATAPNN